MAREALRRMLDTSSLSTLLKLTTKFQKQYLNHFLLDLVGELEHMDDPYYESLVNVCKTAQLLGCMLTQERKASLSLWVILYALRDAIDQPMPFEPESVQSRQFIFGTVAVQQFLGMIHYWPGFAASLTEIPLLQSRRPQIVQMIEEKLD
jgi:CCR4-NOT transcription complex subunit 1 TTP binding domain